MLAAALSAGDWNRSALERRAERLLGRGTAKSQRKLIGRILEEAATPYAPPPARLVRLILASPGFKRIAASALTRTRPIEPWPSPAGLSPIAALRELPVPVLTAPRDLANWLELSPSELDWFADARRQHAATVEPALQHYSYRWLPRKGGPPRLVEAPKARLKAIQRRILREILDHLPAHDCAHGFVKGRSCMGAAQRHAGESLVVTADLRDFFLTVPPGRVHALFRCLGYPWAVARLLTGVCTTATPAGIFDQSALPGRLDWELRKRYRNPHLPQGAPTSPALANACVWKLDCRLHGLARRLDARYTRYADDLAFSGDERFARRSRAFIVAVAAIVQEEGFALNQGKTRVMASGGRQRITGLVVNQHLNVPRAEYETLKATLHNCRRHGPTTQNRLGHPAFRAHLDGRVTWIETVNPRRGLRLRRIYEEIAWPEEP